MVTGDLEDTERVSCTGVPGSCIGCEYTVTRQARGRRYDAMYLELTAGSTKHRVIEIDDSARCAFLTVFLAAPTMTSKKSHQPKGRDHILSTLHRLIQTLDVVKDACSIAPAQAVFCSVSILLTMIRVCPLSSCIQLNNHV